MLDTDTQGATLMVSMQNGDESALTMLIDLWQLALLRFVFRYVQNETDARDIVHETFVRLYDKRQSFRRGASFSGWIFTIAANLARNHVRWRKRHPSAALPNYNDSYAFREFACDAQMPHENVLALERVQAVRAAIDGLSHDLKTTLLLFEYEEFSYRQIAQVVGCSEKGVEARLARARAQLRKRLAVYLNGSAPP